MADAKKTGAAPAAEEEFGPDSKVSGSNFFSFEKVGDNVVGTLVNRDVRKNRLQPGTYQEVYTLVQNDGSEVCVAGRMMVENSGKKVKIHGALHSLPLGTYLKVQFTSEKDVNQPQPAKIIEVFTNRTIKKDVLEKYQGLASKVETDETAPEPDF